MISMSISGMDGSGKSTQCKRLLKRFHEMGIDAKLVHILSNKKTVGSTAQWLNVYSNEMIDFEGYDTVVLAAGNVADDDLYFELKDQVDEIHRVGDCVAPRKTDMAIIEGHRVGRMI